MNLVISFLSNIQGYFSEIPNKIVSHVSGLEPILSVLSIFVGHVLTIKQSVIAGVAVFGFVNLYKRNNKTKNSNIKLLKKYINNVDLDCLEYNDKELEDFIIKNQKTKIKEIENKYKININNKEILDIKGLDSIYNTNYPKEDILDILSKLNKEKDLKNYNYMVIDNYTDTVNKLIETLKTEDKKYRILERLDIDINQPLDIIKTKIKEHKIKILNIIKCIN